MECSKCKKDYSEDELVGNLCQDCFDEEEGKLLNSINADIKKRQTLDADFRSTMITVIVVIAVFVILSILFFSIL